MMPRPWVCIVCVSIACSAPGAALAQDPGATADGLFREGRKLFDDKRYTEACPKLAESFRIDPATGALLALAACHEAEGKTASAWSEFNEVVSRARREGRADRANAAQQRSAALESSLSKLTVVLAPGAAQVPGLIVKRDGRVLPESSFDSALPVDPGEHTIEASAPNRQTWSVGATVAADGATASVSVPSLAEAPTWASTEGDGRRLAGPPFRTIGTAAVAAGVVALGVSGYFTLRAVGKNSDSQSDCTGNACGSIGKQDRFDALSAANASTVAFVVGGVLVAGGVTLFVVGRRAESKPALAAAPAVDRQTTGLVVTGRF